MRADPIASSPKPKQRAAILQEKSGKLMDSVKAERLTGFHVGWISPFDQKKSVPVVVVAKTSINENPGSGKASWLAPAGGARGWPSGSA